MGQERGVVLRSSVSWKRLARKWSMSSWLKRVHFSSILSLEAEPPILQISLSQFSRECPSIFLTLMQSGLISDQTVWPWESSMKQPSTMSRPTRLQQQEKQQYSARIFFLICLVSTQLEIKSSVMHLSPQGVTLDSLRKVWKKFSLPTCFSMMQQQGWVLRTKLRWLGRKWFGFRQSNLMQMPLWYLASLPTTVSSRSSKWQEYLSVPTNSRLKMISTLLVAILREKMMPCLLMARQAWLRLFLRIISRKRLLPTALTLARLAISPVCCLVWEQMVDLRRIQTLAANCCSTRGLGERRAQMSLDSPSVKWTKQGARRAKLVAWPSMVTFRCRLPSWLLWIGNLLRIHLAAIWQASCQFNSSSLPIIFSIQGKQNCLAPSSSLNSLSHSPLMILSTISLFKLLAICVSALSSLILSAVRCLRLSAWISEAAPLLMISAILAAFCRGGALTSTTLMPQKAASSRQTKEQYSTHFLLSQIPISTLLAILLKMSEGSKCSITQNTGSVSPSSLATEYEGSNASRSCSKEQRQVRASMCLICWRRGWKKGGNCLEERSTTKISGNNWGMVRERVDLPVPSFPQRQMTLLTPCIAKIYHQKLFFV